ncbi:hypothetical protein ACFQGT_09845 [Natrialbaceae archaeon GCM10025810]|uniref:hypothetical protein n=1 Tax=Halovalidus salilacus TaxID=3075124 RepID=UPI003611F1F3
MADESSQPHYRQSTGEEDMVKCPYCGDHKRSRGLYLHIFRSSDKDHGGHKDVPDTWEKDKENLEVVGQKELTINVPTSKDFDHELLLCKWCGERFKGTHGLSVHLSRVDDSIHPEDTEVATSGLRIPAGPDVEEELIEDINEEHDLDLDPKEWTDEAILKRSDSAVDVSEAPDGYIPIPDLVELAAHYESREREQCAEELRSLIELYR